MSKGIIYQDTHDFLMAVSAAKQFDDIARPIPLFDERDRESYEKAYEDYKKRSNELWEKANRIRERIQSEQKKAGK